MTRMMAPNGDLGTIPDDKVQEAIAAGFRVMTSDDMRQMYNSMFLQHALFKDQHKKAQAKFQRRSRRRR